VTGPGFRGHGVTFMPIDALSVLCAQLTRDLLAIAKFLSSLLLIDHTSLYLGILYTGLVTTSDEGHTVFGECPKISDKSYTSIKQIQID